MQQTSAENDATVSWKMAGNILQFSTFLTTYENQLEPFSLIPEPLCPG